MARSSPKSLCAGFMSIQIAFVPLLVTECEHTRQTDRFSSCFCFLCAGINQGIAIQGIGVLENKNPEHFAPAMEQLKQRSIDGFFGPVERSATQLEICTNTLSCFDLVCEDDFGTFSTKYHCAQSVGSFSITFGDITGPLCWTEPQQQRFLHHDDSTEVCLNPFPAQVKRLLTQ